MDDCFAAGWGCGPVPLLIDMLGLSYCSVLCKVSDVDVCADGI